MCKASHRHVVLQNMSAWPLGLLFAFDESLREEKALSMHSDIDWDALECVCPGGFLVNDTASLSRIESARKT